MNVQSRPSSEGYFDLILILDYLGLSKSFAVGLMPTQKFFLSFFPPPPPPPLLSISFVIETPSSDREQQRHHPYACCLTLRVLFRFAYSRSTLTPSHRYTESRSVCCFVECSIA